jgi:hypothetical protein
MRYLCLVYVDPALVEAAGDAGMAEITRQSIAYDQELERRGHYVTSDALAEPETAVTLRNRGGRLSRTDGPYAETKEHLGGFILIEARDLNEAIEIGGRIPMAQMGSIEVRPIMAIGERT